MDSFSAGFIHLSLCVLVFIYCFVNNCDSPNKYCYCYQSWLLYIRFVCRRTFKMLLCMDYYHISHADDIVIFTAQLLHHDSVCWLNNLPISRSSLFHIHTCYFLFLLLPESWFKLCVLPSFVLFEANYFNIEVLKWIC